MPTCTKCKQTKEDSNFSFYNKAKGELRNKCKECEKVEYRDNKNNGICTSCGKINNSIGCDCSDCKEQKNNNARNRRKRLLEKGLCTICGKKPLCNKYACEECDIKKKKNSKNSLDPLTNRIWRKNSKKRLKDTVFNAYGGYFCKCCGETIPQFLSIDHMNNDGAAHRKKIGGELYRWLIKNNFPKDFQVLCMNCQWGKHYNNGICPHQTVCKVYDINFNLIKNFNLIDYKYIEPLYTRFTMLQNCSNLSASVGRKFQESS